ncbi:MAG TPA: transcriptional regulator, partial [Bacteroidales bacterium]|nr:transcriptional regulator [Bacteroidales bacterium]
CRAMHIAKGADEDLRPVNVGLFFFCKDPERLFPRTRIELVWHKDNSGTIFTEHYFGGPLHIQLRDALSFIRTNILSEKVMKLPDKAEAERCYNYPYAAIEEALSNAVYHKSYELGAPIEVQVRPDRIEILSYPAAMPPVNKHVLSTSRLIIARQYRNRRIGDFLKELHLTEGRGTGFPSMYDAMSKNGSPAPVFDTDDSSYLLVTLPIHSAFSVQADVRSVQAVDQVDVQLFNTLDDLVKFCDQASDQAIALLEMSVHSKVKDLLRFVSTWKSREEILSTIDVSNRSKHKRKFIDPLLNVGWIEMKHPNQLTHPYQQYKITESGKRLLTLINK